MMDFTDEDVRLAVKHGVSWLDENHPHWMDRVDLSQLSMQSCVDCVIGQAVGDYYEVIAREAGINQHSWAIDHGFQAPDYYPTSREGETWSERDARYDRSNSQTSRYYTKLEKFWGEVILEREG